MSRLQTVADVVSWRMCLGCGACAYICPENKVDLRDFIDEGIRPVLQDTRCGDCTLCLQVCPAVQTDFTLPDRPQPAFLPLHFEREWGPVLELWEGHATDPGIRFRGSSGGALTALAAYCVEELGFSGVLHVGQNPADPSRNSTRLSRSRSELLEAAGSRYSPASVCNGLSLVEQSNNPCVVIGKPAEIAALRNAERLRPNLSSKVGLTLSFFCAETPSTRGTHALLEKMGVPPARLGNLQYRGCGWPGHFAPVPKGQTEPAAKMTYRDSWAFLQAYRPWSVQLWPDGGGELADISCGDPWYQQPDGRNPGSSLVVVRTDRGRRILAGAIKAGYLELSPAEPWKLAKSQSGLLGKKGSVWGRRLALRLLGLPRTRLTGAHLFHCWKPLDARSKWRSVFGTVRRALARKLLRALNLEASQSISISNPCAVEQARSADRRQMKQTAGRSTGYN